VARHVRQRSQGTAATAALIDFTLRVWRGVMFDFAPGCGSGGES